MLLLAEKQEKFRKKLTREQFRRFMSEQPVCVVVFEACGSASYWAWEMENLGHEVKLIALRSVLYEYGHVFPVGLAQLKRVKLLVDAPDCDLPTLIIEECRDLLMQISEKTNRIDKKTRQMKALAAEVDTARRLQTMPGIGPVTAFAVAAFTPDVAEFKSGRGFAAWLGLVPRQYSSGGKERLGRVSKAGQSDIRRLLIIGSMTRLNWLGRRSIKPGSWLAHMLDRKPRMLVAIALANKMARQIWAMLTRNEDYRDPALMAAA